MKIATVGAGAVTLAFDSAPLGLPADEIATVEAEQPCRHISAARMTAAGL